MKKIIGIFVCMLLISTILPISGTLMVEKSSIQTFNDGSLSGYVNDSSMNAIEGYKSTPSFYLKSGQNCFRVDCDVDDIKVLPITETHEMDTYMKDKCCCISSQASCWAKALYYTSRPDKPPFNMM